MLNIVYTGEKLVRLNELPEVSISETHILRDTISWLRIKMMMLYFETCGFGL
jgi:hypothetical protein